MNATPASTSATPAAPAAPLQFIDPRRFKANTREAVDDAHLRRSFRGAMDFLQTRRAAHFADTDAFERLRRLGEALRQYSLSKLPDLLELLEQRLTERGVQVHWAATPEEANARQTRSEADLRGALSNDSMTEDEKKVFEEEQKQAEETAKRRKDDYQMAYAIDIIKGLTVAGQAN